jgi:hypothetical protein
MAIGFRRTTRQQRQDSAARADQQKQHPGNFDIGYFFSNMTAI